MVLIACCRGNDGESLVVRLLALMSYRCDNLAQGLIVHNCLIMQWLLLHVMHLIWRTLYSIVSAISAQCGLNDGTIVLLLHLLGSLWCLNEVLLAIAWICKLVCRLLLLLRLVNDSLLGLLSLVRCHEHRSLVGLHQDGLGLRALRGTGVGLSLDYLGLGLLSLGGNISTDRLGAIWVLG